LIQILGSEFKKKKKIQTSSREKIDLDPKSYPIILI